MENGRDNFKAPNEGKENVLDILKNIPQYASVSLTVKGNVITGRLIDVFQSLSPDRRGEWVVEIDPGQSRIVSVSEITNVQYRP